MNKPEEIKAELDSVEAVIEELRGEIEFYEQRRDRLKNTLQRMEDIDKL